MIEKALDHLLKLCNAARIPSIFHLVALRFQTFCLPNSAASLLKIHPLLKMVSATLALPQKDKDSEQATQRCFSFDWMVKQLALCYYHENCP